MQITKEQYFQLIGLKLIGERKNNEILDLITAVRAITKEKDDYGHSADFIYDSTISIEDLLRRLDIEEVAF